MTRSRTALAVACLPGGAVLTTVLSHNAARLLVSGSSRAGDPAAAVTGLAATGAALIAGWLTLCLALTLAAELPGAVGDVARRLRDQVTPALVQRWAALALGASVGATIAPGTAVAAVQVSETPTPGPLPAPDFAPTADPGEEHTSAVPAPGWPPAVNHVSGPGWVPSRPPARHRTDPHLLTGAHRSITEEQSVVVRRGDTLWSIVATRLGPAATDLEIARAWPRWHKANRTAIGEDPHSLRPGTQLTPPPAT
ncbi:LysM peptidoglycan-binding domain-containing protein [Janibacter cremeus]|uniref:Nucleoid-associated protein YgaU n=1 Tax=Janibacter cremeus TaxID=1285192 RepID=A0A852VT29_9MICO|nr:LysM domain-containing protein [Janibacter cremeus]NYF99139.1 nucleoid-associated protein YgaU [Janibacter cremeus]